MRIGINTLFENPAIGTGGVTYITNLVHELARVDEANDYVLYVSPRNRDLFDVDNRRFQQVLCPFSKERRISTIAFEHSVLPALARRDRLDVFHAPGNIAPAWLPCASVVTIHTLHHWLLPELLPRGSRVYRRLLMPRSIRRADVVIAVSNYVKEKVEAILDVPPDKVVTVYEGAPAPESGDETAVFERVLVPERSILFVSALWPYKNAHTVIEAFARVRGRNADGRKLVIAGTGFPWYETRLHETAAEHGVTDAVVFTGHVPQEQMRSVYEKASVLVYASLEEYFGLPILEAMAAGVPVVASDRSSIPEVVGGAGVLVDPTDADAIADAIARVLDDDAFRLELIARGRERVSELTWERMARETLAVYEQAVARRRRSSAREL